MNKYIEEIAPGQCFSFNNEFFISTTDFDLKNKRLCINLKTGQPRWLKFDTAIEVINIYILDENSNFSPVKEEPVNASTKNTNIS